WNIFVLHAACEMPPPATDAQVLPVTCIGPDESPSLEPAGFVQFDSVIAVATTLAREILKASACFRIDAPYLFMHAATAVTDPCGGLTTSTCWDFTAHDTPPNTLCSGRSGSRNPRFTAGGGGFGAPASPPPPSTSPPSTDELDGVAAGRTSSSTVARRSTS